MCLFPIKARLPPEGGRPTIHPDGDLQLPCGSCRECISKRAIEWATRAKHEISQHADNCFLTLTYDNDHLPSHFIIKNDFQKFLKKLRKKLYKKISYMVSYEYGSQTFRPHMHAIIFGYNPNNQKFLKNTKTGYPLFTSPEISKLWDKGFHSVAVANEKTAYYIASYALSGKKKTITHPETGENVEISDCMDVSKRPAIGYTFFKKHYKNLVATGESLPRYYQKKLEQIDPQLYCQYQDTQASKLKIRDAFQVHAKFVISEAKSSLYNSEYRTDTTDSKINAFKEKYLKNNRAIKPIKPKGNK